MASIYKDIQIEDIPEGFRDIAEVIGLDVALKLVELCGGQAPYIPKMESCELRAKYRRIYEDFKKSKSGAVYSDLAREYNLSESHIRAIVKEMTNKPKPVQEMLFEV